MQYEADEPWHVICIQDPPPKGLPEGGLYDASLPDGPAEGKNRRGVGFLVLRDLASESWRVNSHQGVNAVLASLSFSIV